MEGIFTVSGIEEDNFKTVCSSVDKLDKQPWEEIQEELIKTKNISEEAVISLEKFVRLRGIFFKKNYCYEKTIANLARFMLYWIQWGRKLWRHKKNF